MAMKGAATLVKVCTTSGGSFVTVAEIRSASMNMGAGDIDVAAFGSVWDDMIQGLKNCNFSLGGFWKPSDTNGQIVVRNAFINDTDLFVQFLPNGTAGFQVQVGVTKFDIGSQVDTAVDLTIELRGKGAPSAV